MRRSPACPQAGRSSSSATTVEATGREIQQDLVENDHPMTTPFYVASDIAVKRVDDLDRLVERTVADGTATSLQSAYPRGRDQSEDRARVGSQHPHRGGRYTTRSLRCVWPRKPWIYAQNPTRYGTVHANMS